MGKALGMIETKGLVAALEATDVILKSSNVSLEACEKIGFGLVTIVISGNIGDVKTAIEAGAEAAGCIGEIYAVHVIENPHKGVIEILSKGE
ncbi:BMC domain-containing protein [Romboutsia maritimum]|uniref:BMC domain-containing protein n=1 Tax=Romboutsia maritimum TaxID=2020948 RepID=A0A371ITM9_9FIRM|nr:BMC domain-containing protein [Romboutsia maritimum]RDY23842.1 BMC domain-containing protein [Romboutsia maritimum]